MSVLGRSDAGHVTTASMHTEAVSSSMHTDGLRALYATCVTHIPLVWPFVGGHESLQMCGSPTHVAFSVDRWKVVLVSRSTVCVGGGDMYMSWQGGYAVWHHLQHGVGSHACMSLHAVTLEAWFVLSCMCAMSHMVLQ